jgi:hypothetical protein
MLFAILLRQFTSAVVSQMRFELKLLMKFLYQEFKTVSCEIILNQINIYFTNLNAKFTPYEILRINISRTAYSNDMITSISTALIYQYNQSHWWPQSIATNKNSAGVESIYFLLLQRAKAGGYLKRIIR